MDETKNALITSTMLGIEDHGILTFRLDLDYGGSGQAAGAYALDAYSEELARRVGTAAGTEFILALLRVLDVRKWEDLKGQHLRVRHSFNGVHAVGHLLKDQWLDFEEFFAAYREAR